MEPRPDLRRLRTDRHPGRFDPALIHQRSATGLLAEVAVISGCLAWGQFHDHRVP